jgi:hypothetical protein
MTEAGPAIIAREMGGYIPMNMPVIASGEKGYLMKQKIFIIQKKWIQFYQRMEGQSNVSSGLSWR